MVFEKGSIHLQNSAITHYTILCNISLYCDTKEVIYQYTQNVCCCISTINEVCDWLWENPPLTHEDNYLEKRN